MGDPPGLARPAGAPGAGAGHPGGGARGIGGASRVWGVTSERSVATDGQSFGESLGWCARRWLIAMSSYSSAFGQNRRGASSVGCR